jgi:hypothetical protein
MSAGETQCSRPRPTDVRTCKELLALTDFAVRTAPAEACRSPPVGEGEKWCRRCDSVKTRDAFPAHAGTRDKRQTYCRDCFAELYRERRAREGQVTRPPQVSAGHKFCRGCAQVKPLAEWAPRAKAANGYQFRCRECMQKRDRERHLAMSYGLTSEGVAELLSQQNGVCIICLRAPAVHIDHDHTTGEVRGMLCFRCNAALGQLGDDVDRVRRAADYLQGRKIVMRQIQPGAVEITFPDPLPAALPEREPRAGSPARPLDIRALREAALRGG